MRIFLQCIVFNVLDMLYICIVSMLDINLRDKPPEPSGPGDVLPPPTPQVIGPLAYRFHLRSIRSSTFKFTSSATEVAHRPHRRDKYERARRDAAVPIISHVAMLVLKVGVCAYYRAQELCILTREEDRPFSVRGCRRT